MGTLRQVIVWSCLWAGVHGSLLRGQTRVNLQSQSRQVDFSAASSTKPSKTGTSLPATCETGDSYFLTSGPAGSNLHFCTATNTWTLIGGGAGGSTQDMTVRSSEPSRVPLTVNAAASQTADLQRWQVDGVIKALFDVNGFLTEGIGTASGMAKTLGNAGDSGPSSFTVHGGSGNAGFFRVHGWHDVRATAAPANPAAGFHRWFANSTTGKMACLTDAGADCMPSGGGGLGDPGGNGIVKRTALNTTAPAVENIDYAAPSHATRHQNSGADEVATASAAAGAIPKAGSDGRLVNAWLHAMPAGSAGTVIFENFVHAGNAISGNYIGDAATYFLRNSAGAGTLGGINPTTSAIGIWRLQSATAQNDQSSVYGGPNGSASLFPAPDATVATFEFRVALSPATYSAVVVGLASNSGNSTRACSDANNGDAAYFSVSNTDTAGTWQTNTRMDSSNITTTTTSPPRLADTAWHSYRIVYTSGSVSFYLDGALVNTHSSNLPNNVIAPCFEVRTTNSTPTAAYVDLDAWRYQR